MLTLLELFKLGANREYIVLSTKQLGNLLGISQQGASKHLLELESDGLIERRKFGRETAIKLTKNGEEKVLSLYVGLKSIVESGETTMQFKGRLFTGIGEGAYYVSLHGYKKQFLRMLGFEPYPGTLNLKLTSNLDIEARKRLQHMKGIDIHGFDDGKRTYGPVKCFKAVVNGSYEAAVLVIERTHYDESVLEVISPINLRKALGIKDGDEVNVTVYVG